MNNPISSSFIKSIIKFAVNLSDVPFTLLNPASVRKGFLEMQSCRGGIQTTFVKDSVRTITLKIKIKNLKFFDVNICCF